MGAGGRRETVPHVTAGGMSVQSLCWLPKPPKSRGVTWSIPDRNCALKVFVTAEKPELRESATLTVSQLLFVRDGERWGEGEHVPSFLKVDPL